MFIRLKWPIIDISRASNISLFASERVIGDISGASDITIYGGANTNIDSSGASSIKQRS